MEVNLENYGVEPMSEFFWSKKNFYIIDHKRNIIHQYFHTIYVFIKIVLMYVFS